MIDYFEIYYTFHISKNNVFFTYIFDENNKGDNIKKCKKN